LQHYIFASAFGYIAAFSNADCSKLSEVENDAPRLGHFDPVKIIGGVADLYTDCWSFTYDRISGIHLISIHCAAAEHGVLITRCSAIAERPRCRFALVLAKSGRLELGNNIFRTL